MKSNKTRRKHSGKTKRCLEARNRARLCWIRWKIRTYVCRHRMFLPMEMSVLLKTAKILALVISEAKEKPGWLCFVMGWNIIFYLKSLNYVNSWTMSQSLQKILLYLFWNRETSYAILKYYLLQIFYSISLVFNSIPIIFFLDPNYFPYSSLHANYLEIRRKTQCSIPREDVSSFCFTGFILEF